MTKKRPILDPWFSRPIDWHRTINSPQAVALIDELWTAHFQQYQRPRPGPKPRTAFKDQFGILLVELLFAWLEDPELSLGVPFSVNAYDTRSRYNAPGMSKAIIPMMRTLQEAGLLDVADGSYGGAGKGGNRNTRVRASVALRERFRGLGARPGDFSRRVDQECIVLRDGDVGLVDYTDTPETNAMRTHLRAYNDVLAAAFIDVSTAEGHRVVTGVDRGQSIGPQHHFIHRVFSRGRWDCNAALNNLVDTIEARHPFLDALLFSDRGIGLMNIDAQITNLVHLKFRSQEIIELSWKSQPPMQVSGRDGQ
jgi:hypothetical protein